MVRTRAPGSGLGVDHAHLEAAQCRGARAGEPREARPHDEDIEFLARHDSPPLAPMLAQARDRNKADSRFLTLFTLSRCVRILMFAACKEVASMDSGCQLVLLRHGESEWNKLNLFTGWRDVRLTEQGEREAREAGRADGGSRLELRHRFHVALAAARSRRCGCRWSPWTRCGCPPTSTGG